MIRLANISDVDMVKLIDPFSGDRSEDVKEGRVYIYFVEEDLCGFISMSRAGLLGRPYIQYLAVATSHQQKGIAFELLSYIESKYSDQRLFISTESTNTIMLNLLSKKHYVLAGEIAKANLSGSKEIYYFKESNT
ncbi:MAG: GNAT family N-acetyltransferase [Pseudomonadales bacterium]|nr:GNAT family N-acetyltransferase [Pseudomonadales bacterium]